MKQSVCIPIAEFIVAAGMQIAKYTLFWRKSMKSKYNAHKCIVNGITFDSRKEARRYQELLLLARAGVIQNLQRQVKFVLIPSQYETYERYGKNGQRLKDGTRLVERECVYVADFTYTEDEKLVVEDVKGLRTKDYIIKRKLLLHTHNIRIKEV
jgi:poly-D-alanine transfer protein DltD